MSRTDVTFLTTTICTPGYCEERIHLHIGDFIDYRSAGRKSLVECVRRYQ